MLRYTTQLRCDAHSRTPLAEHTDARGIILHPRIDAMYSSAPSSPKPYACGRRHAVAARAGPCPRDYTIERDGMTYEYNVNTDKDRTVITGTADRMTPFRLVVRGSASPANTTASRSPSRGATSRPTPRRSRCAEASVSQGRHRGGKARLSPPLFVVSVDFNHSGGRAPRHRSVCGINHKRSCRKQRRRRPVMKKINHRPALALMMSLTAISPPWPPRSAAS
jgi:hypothetical protein